MGRGIGYTVYQIIEDLKGYFQHEFKKNVVEAIIL